MAEVMISYIFADGEQIHVTASGKRSYPDAIAELRAQAVKGLKDALADVMAAQIVAAPVTEADGE